MRTEKEFGGGVKMEKSVVQNCFFLRRKEGRKKSEFIE